MAVMQQSIHYSKFTKYYFCCTPHLILSKFVPVDFIRDSSIIIFKLFCFCQEGLTIVENRAAGIIQETKKIQIRRKTTEFNSRGQVADFAAKENLSQNLSDQENLLKESRNVRLQLFITDYIVNCSHSSTLVYQLVIH